MTSKTALRTQKQTSRVCGSSHKLSPTKQYPGKWSHKLGNNTHYHVAHGTKDCIPDSNDIFEQAQHAISHATDVISSYHNEGYKVSGNIARNGIVYVGNYLYVQLWRCNNPECYHELEGIE